MFISKSITIGTMTGMLLLLSACQDPVASNGPASTGQAANQPNDVEKAANEVGDAAQAIGDAGTKVGNAANDIQDAAKGQQ